MSSAVGRQGLSGPSSVAASSASARMRSIPAGHMNARSSAVHGRIEALPSGNGSVTGSLDRVEPLLRLGRTAAKDVQPGAENGRRRVAIDRQGQPFEPFLGGGHSSSAVKRQRERGDEAG